MKMMETVQMRQLMYLFKKSSRDILRECSERPGKVHLDQRHCACHALLESQEIYFCFFVISLSRG
jgi:hypothetical protein